MTRRKKSRMVIWTALGIQFGGQIIDVIWHALHPNFKANTTEEMLVHLGTVHIPIYVGVLCVLAATAWALIDQARRPPVGATFSIAFVGALISTGGEAWHAYKHLQLDTHGGPLAAGVAFLGFLIVAAALWIGGRRDRRRAVDEVDHQRAA